jgi:hypothetical protein
VGPSSEVAVDYVGTRNLVSNYPYGVQVSRCRGAAI